MHWQWFLVPRAHAFYDLTNGATHKLRLFLMYVMAAVRVRNVLAPGTWLTRSILASTMA
jgi:hypothetical protein